MQRIISCGLMGIFGLLFFFFAISPALATELFIPRKEAAPGQQVQIPVMVDQVDNLAGLKLVITYDSNILTFKQAEKTIATSPLMHIVNDKIPGRLIIVMAGATGIKGDQVILMMLTFDVKKEITGIENTQFSISDVQMKNDALKDVPHTVRAEALTISNG